MSGTPVFDSVTDEMTELEKVRSEIRLLREEVTNVYQLVRDEVGRVREDLEYVRTFCEELTKVFEALGNSPMARMLPIGQFKMPEGM